MTTMAAPFLGSVSFLESPSAENAAIFYIVKHY